MAYLTKDIQGIVQLWNNKPEWNKHFQQFQAWNIKGVHNEVPIDVTANNYFREAFDIYELPAIIDIQIICRDIEI